MANLADRLKLLREKHGYTQDELAARVGLTKNAVSMYEHGKRRPTLETLEALSDIFNVTIDYLTGASDTTVVIPDIDFFLNDEERQIIIEYRKKDAIDKEMIRRLLRLSEYATKIQEKDGE